MDEKEWMEWETKIITTSGLISNQPLWLASIVQSLDSSNYGNTLFYNGVDTSSEIKLVVPFALHVTNTVVFNIPMFFSKGLYINMNANLDYITMQFKQQQR